METAELVNCTEQSCCGMTNEELKCLRVRCVDAFRGAEREEVKTCYWDLARVCAELLRLNGCSCDEIFSGSGVTTGAPTPLNPCETTCSEPSKL